MRFGEIKRFSSEDRKKTSQLATKIINGACQPFIHVHLRQWQHFIHRNLAEYRMILHLSHNPTEWKRDRFHFVTFGWLDDVDRNSMRGKLLSTPFQAIAFYLYRDQIFASNLIQSMFSFFFFSSTIFDVICWVTGESIATDIQDEVNTKA